MTNLRRHLENVRGVYGLTPVVAVNRFPSDTDAEVDLVVRMCSHEGVRAYPATHVRDGGVGAEALARGVVEAVREGKSDMRFVYDDHLSLEKKAEAVATRVYGAARVTFEPQRPPPPRPDRGRRLRPPADLHGQDPVVVLHRRRASAARRPGTPSPCARSASPPAPGSSCSSPARS